MESGVMFPENGNWGFVHLRKSVGELYFYCEFEAMNSEHIAICWLGQDKKKHSLARHISKHLSTCVPASPA